MRMRIPSKIGLLIVLLLVVSLPYVDAKDAKEFPGRKLYLDVKYLELDALNQQFDDVLIVDVRSDFEYRTLHIKNALNIALNSSSFISDMRELRDNNLNKLIVTYCNGKTCMKSYKAVRKCQTHGIKNVVAYDAGIMDWAKRHPEKSVLLGVSPIDPNKLISKQRFKSHLLSSQEFIAKANNERVLILDVRDPLQRDGLGLFVAREKRASLSEAASLDKYINMAKASNLTMMIYDEAGKQVRWLMYYLEHKNVKKYYFLEGGAKAYFSKIQFDYISGQ